MKTMIHLYRLSVAKTKEVGECRNNSWLLR